MKAIVTLNIDVDQLKETYKEKNGSLEGFSLEEEIATELGWASSSGISVDSIDKTFEEKADKPFYIKLEVIEGEQGHYQNLLTRAESYDVAFEVAENSAKNWIDEDVEESEDGGYYHDGGTVFVEVHSVKPLSEAEYQLMKKDMTEVHSVK